MKTANNADENCNHNSKTLLEEMNAVQVKRNINEKTIAILVFGACENHGDHMPFGSDFIFPMELAKRIAGKLDKKNSIILPAIPYGVSLHHNEFQMTMSLEPHTLVMVIEDLFRSIIKNGIRRILIINGHDGNIAPIEIAPRTIKDKHPEAVISLSRSLVDFSWRNYSWSFRSMAWSRSWRRSRNFRNASGKT